MADSRTAPEQIAAVLAEAQEWTGTPYVSCAKVKGHGADCLTFIAGVFENAGLIEPVDLAPYPPDWHLHRDEERYLTGVIGYCQEVEGDPQPGDIVLWRFGRVYSHGALVIAWPRIIHAMVRQPCREDDAMANQGLAYIGERGFDCGKPRPRKTFRFKGWVA